MRHLKRKSAALNPKSYALGTSGSGTPLALAAAHTARHQAPTRRLAAASTSLVAAAKGPRVACASVGKAALEGLQA